MDCILIVEFVKRRKFEERETRIKRRKHANFFKEDETKSMETLSCTLDCDCSDCIQVLGTA